MEGDGKKVLHQQRKWGKVCDIDNNIRARDLRIAAFEQEKSPTKQI